MFCRGFEEVAAGATGWNGCLVWGVVEGAPKKLPDVFGVVDARNGGGVFGLDGLAVPAALSLDGVCPLASAALSVPDTGSPVRGELTAGRVFAFPNKLLKLKELVAGAGTGVGAATGLVSAWVEEGGEPGGVVVFSFSFDDP
jgi:hypothetical protein